MTQHHLPADMSLNFIPCARFVSLQGLFLRDLTFNNENPLYNSNNNSIDFASMKLVADIIMEMYVVVVVAADIVACSDFSLHSQHYQSVPFAVDQSGSSPNMAALTSLLESPPVIQDEELLYQMSLQVYFILLLLLLCWTHST